MVLSKSSEKPSGSNTLLKLIERRLCIGGVYVYIDGTWPLRMQAVGLFQHELPTFLIPLDQWFSNCASRRPGASFQFSKGVAGYFGFVPLSLGFIASKEL